MAHSIKTKSIRNHTKKNTVCRTSTTTIRKSSRLQVKQALRESLETSGLNPSITKEDMIQGMLDFSDLESGLDLWGSDVISTCYASQQTPAQDQSAQDGIESLSQLIPSQIIDDWKYQMAPIASSQESWTSTGLKSGNFGPRDQTDYDSGTQSSMMIEISQSDSRRQSLVAVNSPVGPMNTDGHMESGLMGSSILDSNHNMYASSLYSPESIMSQPSSPAPVPHVQQQPAQLSLKQLLIGSATGVKNSLGFGSTFGPSSHLDFSTQELEKCAENLNHLVPSQDDTLQQELDPETMQDLEDILSLGSSNVYSPEQSISGSSPVFFDTAVPDLELIYQQHSDSLELALSTQGPVYYERPIPVAPPASPSESIVSSSRCSVTSDDSEYLPSKETADEPKKRGRKRKNPEAASRSEQKRSRHVSDASTEDGKKRQQNADAAKRYRMKKQKEAEAIFGERDRVLAKREKITKRFHDMMNKRNLMLELLYDSDHGKNIKFPSWFQGWIQKRKSEANRAHDDDD